jgi:capsular exopolysaccharide synthesis family protein
MEDEINLGQYFAVLIKWHRVIILAGLLAGLVAFGVSSMLPPTYEAEAVVTLVKSSTQLNFDPKMRTVSEMDTGYWYDQDARRKALTALVKSSDVATAVIAKIGDRLSAAEHIPANLVGAINGTNTGDVIKITARAECADKAALLANTWTQEYLNKANTIYSETPLTSAELQAQADSAKRDYDQKEDALVKYLASNPTDQLTRQIAQKKQKLDDLRAIETKMDRLTSDAASLRNRLSAGAPSSGLGNELAALLLEANAFSASSNLPANLQIQINQLSAGSTPAEQLRNLNALIVELENRRKTVQEGAFVQLEHDVNQLQSQLEQETAKKQELVRSRELAWSTYNTLSNKAAEATVAAQSKGTVIRLAVPAVAPHAPIFPNKTTNALLASVVGLVLGVGAAFLFEYLNNTLSSAEQVGTLLKVPAIGAIPVATNGNALIVAHEPRSTRAEAYRLLQYSMGMNNAWKVLLVTSALPAEGKSTVAANLAVLMAQAGKKVTLVDANFRHPTQHEIFGLKNSVGLADLLNHTPDAWGADCQATAVDGLSVLPSGPLPPDPVRLLENSTLTDLVERLKAASDIVVIDAPATLGLVDTFVAARVADALLFVVERGRVSRQDALQAKETLAASGAPMVGVVLNRATEMPRAQTYAYYAHPNRATRAFPAWWSAVRERLAALLGLQ